MTNGKAAVFGTKTKNMIINANNVRIRTNTTTRFGTNGFKITIRSGKVTVTAKNVDEIMVAVTTIGIVLIYSPIIPVVRSNGKNAQIVVMVVDQIGTIKSRHTNKPVSAGVNFPLR